MFEELLLFWEGQLVRESGSIGCRFYRIALLAISTDITATRKFGKFLAFHGEKGMRNVCCCCALAKNFYDTFIQGNRNLVSSLCSDLFGI